jgi:molybdate-binding protein
MRRTQGLMVSTGNPLQIKKLVDLARPEVRFINRQKGAGTRLLLDTLMEKEGIRSDRIRGYRHEEFTHTAVATAILAGTADAALGLKYIASQFHLGFVPLEEETFYLAMSPKTHASKPIQKFIQSLHALATKQVGYRAATAGSRK